MRQSIHTDTAIAGSVTSLNIQGRYVGAPKLKQDRPDTVELLDKHLHTDTCESRARRIAVKKTFRQ